MIVCVFVGGPQSGKTTQGLRLESRLSSQFSTHLIDMGEELRTRGVGGATMRVGDLVGDDLVIDIFNENIPREVPEILIAIGFPRSLAQVAALFQLACIGYNICSLNINTHMNEVLQRTQERVQQAKRKGMVPREDDQPEVVQRRINRFKEYGPLVWERLRKLSCASITIQGDESIEEIATKVEDFVFAQLSTDRMMVSI